MEDLRTQLAESLDEAAWEWLKPHFEREAIVVVVAGLDLIDVGEAIASDNVSSVQRWISEQQIYKPSEEQAAAWSEDSNKRFNALIVQPYILVQERDA